MTDLVLDREHIISYLTKVYTAKWELLNYYLRLDHSSNVVSVRDQMNALDSMVKDMFGSEFYDELVESTIFAYGPYRNNYIDNYSKNK